MIPRSSARLSPTWLLVLGTMAGLLSMALWPAISAKFGFLDRGLWFMDSYALLAASEARQAGLDPSVPNPLDVFNRPHSYSSWWFGLGRLGLTRADNFMLGGGMVGAFLVAAWGWLRPGSWREAGWGLAFLLSPPVLLAVNRGNNDLLIGALLCLGLLAWRAGLGWGAAGFVGAVAVATGLKFYPLVAVAGVLAIADTRRRLWALGIGSLMVAGVLASEWEWFKRAVIPLPDGLYLYGAGILWRELGVESARLAVPSALILLGMGGLMRWRGWTIGLDRPGASVSVRAGFIAGAVLLLACWVAGLSYAYRWVLGILLLPWLWQEVAGGGRAARWALGLLLALLWSDGLFCLGSNLAIGPMPVPVLERLQHYWQLLVQPVAWVFHGLLAGWLLDLVWRQGVALRAELAVAPAQEPPR